MRSEWFCTESGGITDFTETKVHSVGRDEGTSRRLGSLQLYGVLDLSWHECMECTVRALNGVIYGDSRLGLYELFESSNLPGIVCIVVTISLCDHGKVCQSENLGLDDAVNPTRLSRVPSF